MFEWGTLIFRKLALIIEYDGTRYHGSQYQVGVPTVQGDVERALNKVTREQIRIKLAGRTDAGVHAKGQVISFGTYSELSNETLVKALNFYLGQDIAVKSASEVRSGFDARRDAVSREYRYRILNSDTPSPLQQGYTYHVSTALDIDAMNGASQVLVGSHDFTSFTGPTKKSTLREVYKAGVSKEEDMVYFDIIANSFLPRQVRFTVGSLIRVGHGKMTVKDFQGILEAKEPASAAPVVPPYGLYLMKVNYPEHKMEKGC